MSAFRRWRKVQAPASVAPAATRLCLQRGYAANGAMIDKHPCALRPLRGAYWAGSVGPIDHAALLCVFDLETKSSGAARTRSLSNERLRSPIEQIAQADAQDFDTGVCRDIRCRSKGSCADRPIQAVRAGSAVELQVEVFDPKQPIRKDAPLKSGPGRPTVGRCRIRGAVDCEHTRRFGTLGTVASLGNGRGLVRPGKPAAPTHEQIVEHVADASADRAKVVNLAGAGRAVDHPGGSLRTTSGNRPFDV